MFITSIREAYTSPFVRSAGAQFVFRMFGIPNEAHPAQWGGYGASNDITIAQGLSRHSFRRYSCRDTISPQGKEIFPVDAERHAIGEGGA